MTNKEIIELFEDIFYEDDFKNTSRLHDPEFYVGKASSDGLDEYEVLHLKLFGGMNSWGDSKDYLYDLYELIETFETNGIYAYLTNMEIDALDDVFYVDFQLRDLEEFNKEKPE